MSNGVPVYNCALPLLRRARPEGPQFRLLELPARTLVHGCGEPFDEAYVLCSGTVVRFRELDGDARKVVELVHTPQLLGCGEFFGASRHESGCETASACALIALDAGVLRAVAERSLVLTRRMLQAVAARLCEVEFDVAGRHASRTSAQRILDYLVELAGGSLALAGETTVELASTKKVLAARIGITPEAFSRSLRELADKGVIVVDKRLIHIQNAATLDTGAGEQPQRLIAVGGDDHLVDLPALLAALPDVLHERLPSDEVERLSREPGRSPAGRYGYE